MTADQRENMQREDIQRESRRMRPRRAVWAALACILTATAARAQTPAVPGGLISSQAAAIVVGQKNFSDITSAATNERVGALSGLAIAGNKLIVVDSSYLAPPNNNRVLIYNNLSALKQRLPQADLPPADVIVGQSGPNLTAGGTSATQMFQPAGVASDGTRLFVAEWGNNRILIYNQIPASDGAAADVVIGQSSFTTSDFGTTTTALRRPNGVATDGTRLFVADTLNNRVLIYNRIPAANGAAADVEIGQPGFTTFAHLPAAANTLFDPMSATTDGTRLIVADLGNNRVLIYNHIPTSNNAAADVVVGQPNFSSSDPGNTATNLNFPRYAFSDGTRLVIVDSGNNRILIYNQIPTSNGAAADIVLGQEDFLGLLESCAASNFAVPFAAASDGDTLFVSDSSNRRILGFRAGANLVDGVVNGASFSKLPQTAACDVVLLQPPVAPGGIASIFGHNLANETRQADSLPLPTSMGGVKVKFNGIAAPLFYVSPTQLNVQVPFEVTGFSASMVVEREQPGGGTTVSSAAPVGVADGAPGVFAVDSTGSGRGIITHADFSLVTEQRPATPGETLIAWATGLGHADQTLTTGAGAQFSATGTVTVAGVAGAGQTVSIVINGRVYSYTAASGDGLADIVGGLAALIDQSDPEVSATADAENSAVNLSARTVGDQQTSIVYSTFVSDGSSLSSSVGAGTIVPGTITFSGTPRPGQTIVISLLSTTYIYTVVSGDTAADVVRKLAAQVDGDPNVAAAADTSSLTITLTLDDPGAGLSIPFGVIISKPGAGIVPLPSGSTVPGNIAFTGVATAGQVVTVRLQDSAYSYATTGADTLASVVTNLANLLNSDPNVSATADTASLTINLALKTPNLSIRYTVSVKAAGALAIDNGGAGSVPATLTVTGTPQAGQMVTVFLGGTRYAYTVENGDTAETVATRVGGLLAADPRVTVSVSGAAIDIQLAAGSNDLQVSAGGATAVPATITVSGTPRAGQLITLKVATATYRYTVKDGDTASSVAASLGTLLANDVNVTATVTDTQVALALKNATASISLNVSVSLPLASVVTAPPGFDAVTSAQHFVPGVGHTKNTVSAFVGETLPAVPGDILFFGTPDPGQTITVTLADTTYSYTTITNDTLSDVVTKLAEAVTMDPNVSATADTTGERILLDRKDATATAKIGFTVSVAPAATATLLAVARSTTTTDSLPAVVAFAGPAKGFVGLDQVNFTVPSAAPEDPNTKLTLVQNLIVFGSITQNNIFSAPVTFPVVPLLQVNTGGATTVPATLTLSGTPLAGEFITVTLGDVDYTYTMTASDTLETIAANLAAVINADVNVSATANGAAVSLQLKGSASVPLKVTVGVH